MSETDLSSNSLMLRTNWHTALLCSGVIGAVLFTTVYFCFSVISPNYFMMHESISRLQLQPYGWVQSLNYIIAGLLICAFAAGLRKEMVSGFGIVLIPLFHAITGLGSILLGLFTSQPVQTYIGGVTFIALVMSFFLMARRFASDPQWRGWVTYTLLTVVLMIVLCVFFDYSLMHTGRFSGIFERLIVITRLVWLFFFTARLLSGRNLAPVVDRELSSVATEV
jgi:hypothetical protein